MANGTESGLLFGWTLQEWLGVIGFIIASAIGIMQLIDRFILRPRFKITHEVSTVTDSRIPYGYFDLIITNKGRHTAKDCDLTLTIAGANRRFKDVPLEWGNPHRKNTAFAEKIDIKGDGDKFQTVIFNFVSNEDIAIIQNLAARIIEVKKGEKHTFIFSVNSDPPAKKTARFNVEVNAWNDIKIRRIRWYHRLFRFIRQG